MPGPTEQTYVPTAEDVGTEIQCRVTASNAQGSVTRTTAPIVPVAKEPVSIVIPAITGTLVVGQTLSATTGTWTGIPTITFAYQWRRDGADITDTDADNSTYNLGGNDANHGISVTVTASNAFGDNEATSGETADIDGGILADGLEALTDNNFTWLDGRTLSNGATGNWVPSVTTAGTGTAILGATTGAESSDPAVSSGVLTLDGVNDHVVLAANAIPSFTPTTGKWTVIVVYSTAANNGRLYSCESATAKGLYLYFTSGTLRTTVGGVTTAISANRGSGMTRDGVQVNVAAGVVDDGTVQTFAGEIGMTGPSNITGVGTITFGATAKVGVQANGTAASPFPGKIYAVLYANVALSSTELANAAAYLKNEYD